MNILLIGQPNVGKSVIFSQLTGVRVLASNYPGSTVSFTEGCTSLGHLAARVVDAPGTYSLSSPSSAAEEVVVRMLDDADLVVNVVDATGLERNLHLTLEVLDLGKPTVVALNMWDEAAHKGITIDVQKLEEELGVPVIPTVAIAGEGLKALKEGLQKAHPHSAASRLTEAERWATIGRITSRVQSLEHRHHTFLEWLGDCSVRMSTGLPIAILVLAASFFGNRLFGEGAQGYVLEPVFERAWRPVTEHISDALNQTGLTHQLLIGKLIDGRIDFLQSFGLLTTGLFVPFAVVLPFVLAFYFWLGILRKDMAMGMLATMDLTIKQLVVAGTLLSMFFPCIATFVVLAKELGWRDLGVSILIMLVASVTAGTTLNLLL